MYDAGSAGTKVNKEEILLRGVIDEYLQYHAALNQLFEEKAKTIGRSAS
jgi:hypothetical protein